MRGFNFRGEIPASKSILNRALIVQSYSPDLKVLGDSRCEDVLQMRRALQRLQAGDSLIDCGEGGTTFRFLSLRASRLSGEHLINGEPRLMRRPQAELVKILDGLGVDSRLTSNGLSLESTGWKQPSSILEIDASTSSQYASSLLLNAWCLDFELKFKITGRQVSTSYFEMTRVLVHKLGMQVHCSDGLWSVPPRQKVQAKEFRAETDLSSCLVFAAAGALAGTCEILHFPQSSSQPDRAFVEIFQSMGIFCHVENEKLVVQRAAQFKAIEYNLSQAPDLFPVLAVLCSFATGVSRLHGAPHLAVKESDRIQKVSDLFKLVGVEHECLPDGMVIHGRGFAEPLAAETLIEFDPAHDHRMVMAAALLKLMGYSLRILHPESVNKSLPEFFELFGVQS